MINHAAFDTAQLAKRLAQGYYAHKTALAIAAEPRARELMPQKLPGFLVPIGTVERKDGTKQTFDFEYFLTRPSNDPDLNLEFEQAWLAGSLLKLGDTLEKYDYFEHAPELELVYHLRNGIAHGNRFNITSRGRDRLREYPAHNRLAWVQSDTKAVFEITISAVQGQPVLYDFMGAGDVLDIFLSVHIYLERLSNGDPLRP
jgi:hypothetical protein